MLLNTIIFVIFIVLLIKRIMTMNRRNAPASAPLNTNFAVPLQSTLASVPYNAVKTQTAQNNPVIIRGNQRITEPTSVIIKRAGWWS